MPKFLREDVDAIHALLTVTLEKSDYADKFNTELATYKKQAQLKGFRKVNLKAGESTVVSFEITPESRSFFRADNTWGEEPGDFEVFAGHDSHADLKCGFKVVK